MRIEATPDNDRLHDDHPFNDCAHEAIQLAISKDGREWAFHFPAGPGSVRNREFARFDIVQDPEQQVADELEKYLAFHEVSREVGSKEGRSGRSVFPIGQAREDRVDTEPGSHGLSRPHTGCHPRSALIDWSVWSSLSPASLSLNAQGHVRNRTHPGTRAHR